ncbi:SDR family oxidoreductase [Bradyrhizobium sp.]|uniref:MaoC family dehydratase n=1 Tax=Bradyrhizobium sp. TaxID=376 RepID=UPI003C4E64B9
MTAPLASRSFGLDDQIAFATLSSDWNPIHLDQAFARRTQAGAPIVHGIHNLAWAADAVLRTFPIAVANIRARFLQPLYLDEAASVQIRQRTDRQIEFEVVTADVVVALVKLTSEPGKKIAKIEPRAIPAAPLSAPADLSLEQLAGRAGAVAMPYDDVRSLFPALTDAIGLNGAKALLATSGIVGMACPGLHSLFAGLDINFGASEDQDGTLAYAVRKLDTRFRSLQIDIAGGGAAGRLEAFSRPSPPRQPGMAEIAPHISGRPFAGQRTLVIGGSRGLGEVTAKIIAAGGGRVVITYRNSAHEAERVAADIAASGEHCDVRRYDALSPPHEQLTGLEPIDCCYYFATPKIFLRRSARYEPDRLRHFLSFYADGFYDLCAALAAGAARPVAVFYPSTVAIEQGLGTTAEYAMAKAAGETLAGHLGQFMPNIAALTRRLPRILTDQTATVGVASTDNALDVLLPIVYQVQQMARQEPAPPG